jgi:hypothetical protein
MTDESTNKPKLEILPSEELDAEEEEFRRLRRDLPGVKGAADVGLIAIGVGKEPTPKHEFYRTSKEFRMVVSMVSVEAGMDKHFVAVDPAMVVLLTGLGITVTDHTLYLIITPRGALKIIPVPGPNRETGEQNEWHRTKEIALFDGTEAWVRMYSDKEGNCYRSYPAPLGRFGEPAWPTIKPAKIFRLAFRDRAG